MPRAMPPSRPGAISGTTAAAYGINLGTLTGGTTSNYQIQTGNITSIASATNAGLVIGTTKSKPREPQQALPITE